MILQGRDFQCIDHISVDNTKVFVLEYRTVCVLNVEKVSIYFLFVYCLCLDFYFLVRKTTGTILYETESFKENLKQS
jgi:hypothetical protein